MSETFRRRWSPKGDHLVSSALAPAAWMPSSVVTIGSPLSLATMDYGGWHPGKSLGEVTRVRTRTATKQLYSFDPHMLDTPKAHVETFKGSLQYQGPVLWNSLAADQRQLTSTWFGIEALSGSFGAFRWGYLNPASVESGSKALSAYSCERGRIKEPTSSRLHQRKSGEAEERAPGRNQTVDDQHKCDHGR
ncbi:hypothetical protein Bbelb_158350 [Branchiostoma belcheri]|nr:hypothetical protein Bbelb_158350 [Branchiostoma belcheri]